MSRIEGYDPWQMFGIVRTQILQDVLQSLHILNLRSKSGFRMGIYMDLLMNGGWFLRPKSPESMGPAQDPQLIREALRAMPSAERETEVCPWWWCGDPMWVKQQ